MGKMPKTPRTSSAGDSRAQAVRVSERCLITVASTIAALAAIVNVVRQLRQTLAKRKWLGPPPEVTGAARSVLLSCRWL